MSKNNPKLNLSSELPAAEPVQESPKKESAKQESAKAKKNTGKAKSGRPNIFQRIGKFFKDMLSELKKVDWPPMQKTKSNPGVLANLSTVLVVVLFFLVIMTAFDFGLTALMNLLLNT